MEFQVRTAQLQRSHETKIFLLIFTLKKVTDAEKEKFRKYVERSGAIDQLVRGIASLYDG